jgi:hypothetical protein
MLEINKKVNTSLALSNKKICAGIMKWNHLIARASMIERPEPNI